MPYPTDLTDNQWDLLESLLCPPSKRGPKHGGDLRHVLDGILYITHTGCQWRFLPAEFGPWARVWSQFRRWSRNGTWGRVLAAVHEQAWSIHVRTVRAMTKPPTMLVNCTGKPQFVIADGRLVALPVGRAPQLIETADSSSAALVRHFCVDDSATVVTMIEDALKVALMWAPPVTAGTTWLVTSQVFSRFPHRDDFVRASWYALADLDGLDVSDVEASNISDQLRLGKLLVLGAVSRSACVTDAATLSLPDEIDGPDVT